MPTFDLLDFDVLGGGPAGTWEIRAIGAPDSAATLAVVGADTYLLTVKLPAEMTFGVPLTGDFASVVNESKALLSGLFFALTWTLVNVDSLTASAVREHARPAPTLVGPVVRA